ncbi:MAG: tetratricopeptide repeat protein [Chloroflexota bacterium]|nr:tetratricopeptide repeat protein [Chloroflexota bacterium]
MGIYNVPYFLEIGKITLLRFLFTNKTITSSAFLIVFLISLSCSGSTSAPQSTPLPLAISDEASSTPAPPTLKDQEPTHLNPEPSSTPELEALFIYNRGVRSLRVEEYNDAVNAFTQVIRRMPNLAIAYKGRGAAYYHENRLELAIVDLEKALELDVDLGGAHMYLGMLLRDQGDLIRAEEELIKAVNLIHPVREKWELIEAERALSGLYLK